MSKFYIFVITIFSSVISYGGQEHALMFTGLASLEGGLLATAERGFVFNFSDEVKVNSNLRPSDVMLTDVARIGDDVLVVGHDTYIGKAGKAVQSFSKVKIPLESREVFFDIETSEDQKHVVIVGTFGTVVVIKESKAPVVYRAVMDEIDPHLYKAIHINGTKFVLIGEKGASFLLDSETGAIKQLAIPGAITLFGGQKISGPGDEILILAYGLVGKVYVGSFSGDAVKWRELKTAIKIQMNSSLQISESEVLIGGNAGFLFKINPTAGKESVEYLRYPKKQSLVAFHKKGESIYLATARGMVKTTYDEIQKWKLKK